MHILLVDNERDSLLRSANALQNRYADAEIISTTDAMDAVQYSLNHPVDAVYTEVLLPRCSGFDVVRLVLKFRPDADAYILSSAEQFAAQVRKQGLGQYLSKSVLWAEAGLNGASELTDDELEGVAAAGEKTIDPSRIFFNKNGGKKHGY